MTDLTGNTFFEGPAGRLEAILKEPEMQPGDVAIVCHPHPLFGGTMHNKVVFQIARAFQDAGYAVLRFNFRGVGKSAGEHAYGIGERDDLRAAIDFILGRHSNARLWVAGFSFGAAVMLSSCCDNDLVQRLIAAGTPMSKYDFHSVAPCGKPKLFIQGERDEFGSVVAVEQMIARLGEPSRLKVVSGADHFFEGRLAEVVSAVSEFVEEYD